MELFRSKLRITQNCTRDLQSQMSFINEVEEMRFADVPRNWGQLAKLMDDKCKALATLEDERKSRHEEHVESQQQQQLNWWALYKLRKSDADDQVDARFACPLAARKFKKGTTDDFVPLSSLWEFLNTFYEQELEQKTLMAYWRYMGARKFDPVEDYWDDLTQDENGNWWMMRWCIKSEDKLPELCPVDEEFVPLLLQYRKAMEEQHGSLKRVPMFPWLRRWHKWEVENKKNERRVDGEVNGRLHGPIQPNKGHPADAPHLLGGGGEESQHA